MFLTTSEIYSIAYLTWPDNVDTTSPNTNKDYLIAQAELILVDIFGQDRLNTIVNDPGIFSGLINNYIKPYLAFACKIKMLALEAENYNKENEQLIALNQAIKITKKLTRIKLIELVEFSRQYDNVPDYKVDSLIFVNGFLI